MLIKKWRVLAMLNNIKLWINNERSKEEIIEIIDNYIKFVSSIKDPEGD